MEFPTQEYDMSKKKYVTIAELARRIDRPERVVRYWISKGLIEYVRDGLTPGARMIIPMEEVDRIVKQLPQGDVIESA